MSENECSVVPPSAEHHETVAIPSENNSNSSCDTAKVCVVGAKEKKKVRRAFSMPLNPFRLSRRFLGKQSPKSCGSPPNAATATDCLSQSKGTTTNEKSAQPAAAATTTTMNETESNRENSAAPDAKHHQRVFRRTSFKKFMSRIAQQMTSISIGVSHIKCISLNN